MKTISKVIPVNLISWKWRLLNDFLPIQNITEENLLHIYVELANTSLDHTEEDSQCRREKLWKCVSTEVVSLELGTQQARDDVWRLTVNEAYLRTSNNRWHSPRLFTFPIGKKPDVEIRGGEGTVKRGTEHGRETERQEEPRGVSYFKERRAVICELSMNFVYAHRVWSTFDRCTIVKNRWHHVRATDLLIGSCFS